MAKLHLYRRKGGSPRWQAQVYVGGQRHRFSCRTSNKVAARRYAQQRVGELESRYNRCAAPTSAAARISQVLQRYEHNELPKLRPTSQRRTLGILGQARAWFVHGPLRDPQVARVTARDIQAFLDLKRSEGVSARTVNLYRATLHRLFKLCVSPWLLIPSNPVSGTETLREEPREPELIGHADYERLLDECWGHAFLTLFVVLAWETGARSGEILQLEWNDVNFERALLTFVNDRERGRTTKGRRSRTVPLSARAVDALREHAAAFRFSDPQSPYLFKHLTPNRNAKPGDRVESLYEAFRKAARAAGFRRLRPHDLRHCFVTRKLADGVPAQLVMRYVGHADLATTLRYAHLVPEHLRTVVQEGERASVAIT